jgi:hypothetical protein
VRIELLAGQSNVVRFPIELRQAPSLDVVASMEPDFRAVCYVAESFAIALPPADLRHRVEGETASYIATHLLPLARHERRAALDELTRPVLAAAVEACRRAERAAGRSAVAERNLLRAETEGSYWVQSLAAAADASAQEAAELLIAAHQRCEEAHGVSRAVAFAQREEPWTPVRPTALTEWLIAAGEADQTRGSTRSGSAPRC